VEEVKRETRGKRMTFWGAGASYLVLVAKYNFNDQVKEDEMCTACSTNW
jgi:hypothetical protein